MKLAGRLSIEIHKIGTGKGSVEIGEIQVAIQAYGVVNNWRVSTPASKWSLLGKTSHEWVMEVTLLYPGSIPAPKDNRECRTEMYLQAESIVETLKQLKIQLIHPPKIILGGYGEQIEGTLEVEFYMLWGVGPEWLYGTALLMRRRLKRRSSVRI